MHLSYTKQVAHETYDRQETKTHNGWSHFLRIFGHVSLNIGCCGCFGAIFGHHTRARAAPHAYSAEREDSVPRQYVAQKKTPLEPKCLRTTPTDIPRNSFEPDPLAIQLRTETNQAYDEKQGFLKFSYVRREGEKLLAEALLPEMFKKCWVS